jgi:hypothetical protein
MDWALKMVIRQFTTTAGASCPDLLVMIISIYNTIILIWCWYFPIFLQLLSSNFPPVFIHALLIVAFYLSGTYAVSSGYMTVKTEIFCKWTRCIIWHPKTLWHVDRKTCESVKYIMSLTGASLSRLIIWLRALVREVKTKFININIGVTRNQALDVTAYYFDRYVNCKDLEHCASYITYEDDSSLILIIHFVQ